MLIIAQNIEKALVINKFENNNNNDAFLFHYTHSRYDKSKVHFLTPMKFAH